ncbi:MAG TPA: Rieske 2Fe-2S domain-containing protein [Gaiellaceae bacterium]|nr:Rieske 2Fe-2S domain-containing protein [Gaiellaceae bacterium]
MADELERPEEAPEEGGAPHLPPPTIWPFAFAAAIALVLVGLIVSIWATVIGLVLGVVFGFLWIRDVTREVRAAPEPVEAAAPAVVEEEGPAGEPQRFERSKFLEGATLGIGAVIGGIVTVPALGFAVAPAFVGQDYPDVDLGSLDEYPEGEWQIVTFTSDPEQGTVSRRTAFIRNNGLRDSVPSFTILSNRCVHLGCPTQPQGPPGEPRDIEAAGETVTIQPTQPSAFGCPCHGGAYDIEGNRTAGPPVRALDRYEYSIVNGNLQLGAPYSVGNVEGTGTEAVVYRYKVADPGVHVDGVSQVLYPYVP